MTVPLLRGSVSAAPADADASGLLVLLPSLGTSTALWDGVLARLADAGVRDRVLRVDLPGHGASPAAAAPFTVAELAEGVLRVVDGIGGGRFAVAGVSLGGAVSLELAAAHPDRVRAFAMFCSAARIGTAESWAERATQVRGSGTASLVTATAGRWFAPGYLDREPAGPGPRALSDLVDADDASYIGCVEALGAFDRRPTLPGIAVPALIVAGEVDPVIPLDDARAVADALPRARFEVMTGTSHLAPLEDPGTAAGLLADLLADGSASHAAALSVSATAASASAPAASESASVHETGMRTRRQVLGDAHVDRAVAATTPQTAPFQDFITRYAWGDVWSRPGLGRRERSVATLAVLVADSHEHELRMHIRAARRNGLTGDEIAEVMLHTALYAGLPPANRALAILTEVLAEDEEDHV
jgi:3-oxoadipate enol-lactonase / 4-carboxymuconolactone decarboxylase